MAHQWEEYSKYVDGDARRMSEDVGRKCSICGAIQWFENDGAWMRISRKWLPLVGKCKASKS